MLYTVPFDNGFRFHLQQSFPNMNARTIGAMTWLVVSDLPSYAKVYTDDTVTLVPKVRIDESALVVHRATRDPNDGTISTTDMLMWREETARGYIVNKRSIASSPPSNIAIDMFYYMSIENSDLDDQRWNMKVEFGGYVVVSKGHNIQSHQHEVVSMLQKWCAMVIEPYQSSIA